MYTVQQRALDCARTTSARGNCHKRTARTRVNHDGSTHVVQLLDTNDVNAMHSRRERSVYVLHKLYTRDEPDIHARSGTCINVG